MTPDDSLLLPSIPNLATTHHVAGGERFHSTTGLDVLPGSLGQVVKRGARTSPLWERGRETEQSDGGGDAL